MWFLNSLARRTLSRYALFNAYLWPKTASQGKGHKQQDNDC